MGQSNETRYARVLRKRAKVEKRKSALGTLAKQVRFVIIVMALTSCGWLYTFWQHAVSQRGVEVPVVEAPGHMMATPLGYVPDTLPPAGKTWDEVLPKEQMDRLTTPKFSFNRSDRPERDPAKSLLAAMQNAKKHNVKFGG